MTTMLQDYVRRAADARPEKPAIVSGADVLTYGELERQSNQLARLLRESGCGRGDRVCLFLPKSPATIMSMLGVLKADCAYVPIDAASPAARTALILGAAEPSLILATAATSRLVGELQAQGAIGSVGIATLDADPIPAAECRFARADLDGQPEDAVATHNTPDDPAHLLFTSGSTGVPKGVVITHRNVAAFVEWGVDTFGIAADDRLSGHTPLHFDLSTFDIYGAFCAGAELHPIPPALNAVPHRIAELVRSAELTQWFSVPSAMAYLAANDVVRHGDFPALRRVLFCGEVLPTPVLIHWMERLPHATFTNLYGPTEATIASSYYTVPEIPADMTDPIPIGIPCTGEELLVLDEELLAVPDGEVGDLYIAGVGLSPGYWRDEEKTAAAFLPDPRADGSTRVYRTGDLARVGADGLVYFHGRADQQIKSRGYRIELGEIETALATLAFLSEAAVVAVDSEGFGGTEICCAYAASEPDVESGRIAGALRSALPAYMIPTRWLPFDELPKNVNGKIDRRGLKDRFESATVAG